MGDDHTSKGLMSDAEAALIDAENSDISDIVWYDAPIFAVFWLLILVVFLQFVTRYVFNNSISWTEEIARYLLIAVAYTGGIICARKNSHINLVYFLKKMPKRMASIVQTGTDLLTAGCFFYLSWLGVSLAQRVANQRMVSIDFPRAAIFWLVSASLTISALVILHRSYRRLRG
jgi:TRAP-type C4-dicarboxylate transport system permease small subunit